MWKLVVFLMFLTVIVDMPCEVKSARILCIFQVPVPSHQQTFRSISRALSLRGHQVLAVTPMPINDPSLTNLTEMDISGIGYERILGPKFEFFWSKELALHTKIRKIMSIFGEVAEAILAHEPFRKIYMDENQKFDLIITQTYVNPTLYALSEKLKAPIIGASSMGLWSGSHVAAGNTNPPSLYSDMYAPYNGDLTLYERIKSTLYFLWSRYFVYFEAMPKYDKLARKYLGEDLPYLADIERNVSALFLNINPIFYTPRPMVPTMVPISFLHIQPPKPLPKDILQEIESSKKGVIYFSLGSSLKGVNVPEKVTNIFVEAMAELPYKILWKFEDEQFPNKPKNVVIRKWFPQQDVLAHPKVILFVSQCGLQSFEEAVDREVPIICIPFISDQELNSRKLAGLGLVREIDYLNTTKEELAETILDVAKNPIYKQHMKYLNKLLRDEPMTGLEKVVWWSEFVIRHKGTKHLRSPTADIEWYKYLLLDVFAALVGAPILLLITLVRVIKLFRKKPKEEKKKVKKQ